MLKFFICLLFENPAKIIKKVYFSQTNDFRGVYENEDILNSKDYKSHVFIHEIVNNKI